MYDRLRHLLLLLPFLPLVCPTVTHAQIFPALHAYESCTFTDGLQVVELAPLAPGVTSRSVKTRKGVQSLQMSAGRRVMFAYPESDFYANVKVELLPESQYAEQKQLVVDGQDYILASDQDIGRNYDLPGKINGFEVQGFDRSKLEGGVLGIYLLVDDADRIVTTIYFLNQEPDRRKFKTMAEYAQMRNTFLSSYTGCIRSNLNAGK